MFYEMIGRAVMRLSIAYIRQRYGRQLRVLAGASLVAVLVGGYLASRSVKEG